MIPAKVSQIMSGLPGCAGSVTGRGHTWLSVSLEQARNLIRRTHAISIQEIVECVAADHHLEASSYVGFRKAAPGREMAALLCRRLTPTTLAELSAIFGLSHKDSSANLVCRAKIQEQQSENFSIRLKLIENKLLKTVNRV